MNPQEWIIYGEVGTSSKTIWSVMTGIVENKMRCDGMHFDTPKDPDDFSRCFKLLTLFPVWRSKLFMVADRFPKWIPFVREWDNLEKMYYKWQVNIEKYFSLPIKERKKFKFDDGMYNFMQKLDDEAMVLDGWVKEGNNYTRRNI